MPPNPEVSHKKIAAIAMVAGAGSRFGHQPKSLLQRDGEPLIARQLRLLAEAGIEQTVVVLGHHAPRVAPVLAALKAKPEYAALTWVCNPSPNDGPGSSLRCGLAALPVDLDGVLVLLGDQPLLEVQDIRAVLSAWLDRAPHIELVVPTHAGQPGHPLVFGPQARQAVQAASATTGLRDWRRAHPRQVQSLAVDHLRCTTDIDTQVDVARLAAEHGVSLAWVQSP